MQEADGKVKDAVKILQHKIKNPGGDPEPVEESAAALDPEVCSMQQCRHPYMQQATMQRTGTMHVCMHAT